MKLLFLASILLLSGCGEMAQKMVNGNTVSEGYSLLPDTEAPVVTIASPVTGTNLYGIPSSAISALAKDDRAVAKVEIYKGPVLLATIDKLPYDFTWNTVDLPEGSHDLHAIAYDTSGNAGKSEVVKLIVLPPDVTAPVTQITAPVSGSTVSGKASLVTATAQDDRGVSRVDLYINDNKVVLKESAPGIYSYSWDTSVGDNGTYTLQTKAYDAAGNEGSSAVVSVTVDNDKTPPVTAITAPTGGATATGKAVSIQATATDNIKVERVDLYVNDKKVALPLSTGDTYALTWDTTLLANGDYKLQTKAYDAIGNEGVSAVVSVTVYNDNVPPVTAVTAPASNATVMGPAVKITATASDNKGLSAVILLINGVETELTAAANSYSYTWDTTKVQNGSYTLQSKATDSSGNVGKSAVVTVKVENDVEAPVTAVTSPSGGSKVSGKAVSIKATATDNLKVTSFEFYLNGVLTPMASTAAGQYSYTWDTSALANGDYTLQTKAKDAAGNEGVSAVVTVTVYNDKELPVTAVTAPADKAKVSGKTVVITATASDNVALKSVDLYIKGVKVALTTGAPGQYSYSWDISGLANGTYALQTKAKDTSDNEGVSAVVNVEIYHDKEAPQVAITAPTPQAVVSGKTVTVTALATDNVSVAKVELYRDGNLIATDATNRGASATYSFVWDSTKVANGLVKLRAKAYDADGNVGTSAEVYIFVYNQEYVPPVVSFIKPGANSTVSGASVEVLVNAIDPSGVTRTELFVNGVLVTNGMQTSDYVNFSHAWNTILGSNGPHTLLAKAYDAYGNVGTAEVTVTVYNEITDLFTQTVAKKELEVLWVIDNSVSMDDEQDELAANFDSFINQFTTVKDVPFRMGITTTSSSCTTGNMGLLIPGSDTKLTSAKMEQNQQQFIADFQALVRVGTTYDDCAGSEQGLQAAESYLQRYATTHVKRDTYLAIIILTDESDKSPKTVQEYLTAYAGYKNSRGLIKVYSICDIAGINNNAGTTASDKGCVKDTEASTLSSGVVSNIYGNFASDLSTLGKNLTTLVDSHALSRVPTPGSLKVFVNNEEENDYSYDAATNSIKFNEASIPATGATIKAVYTPM